jgi:hypothetical protein
MTIDPEIIKDLLPLYRTGMASAPSRRLVEAWLAEHGSGESADRGDGGGDDALAALERARRLRRRLRWLYGLAIGLTVLCASLQIDFEEGRPASVRPLALDMPLLFAPLIAGAIAAWAAYFLLRRRLR